MSKKVALCFFCKSPEPRADVRSKAVLCNKCVARLSGSPKSIGKSPKTEAERLATVTSADSSEGVVKKPRAKKAVKKSATTRTRKTTVVDEDVVEKKPSSRKKTVAKKASPKTDAGWGRGWHFKKNFVGPDGVTYSFGQPISEN